MKRGRAIASVVFLLLACVDRRAPLPPGELLGEARVAITNAPADATCIRIDVTGGRAVRNDLDVPAGASTVLALRGLPIGDVIFTGAAFAGACSAVTNASVPTWIGDPVNATLVAGLVVDVRLALRRGDGRASVTVDFVDDAGSADASDALCSAPEIVGDGIDQNCDGREVCFADADGDGARSASGALLSADLDCDDAGEASVSAPIDCCDSDASARPGLTAFHGMPNACGSFDYDCDGAATQRYQRSTCNSPLCIFQGVGFADAVPPCGSPGPLVITCSAIGAPMCTRTLQTALQLCR